MRVHNRCHTIDDGAGHDQPAVVDQPVADEPVAATNYGTAGLEWPQRSG